MKFKQFKQLVGFTIMFSFYIVMVITFFFAFFDPTKTTTIYINLFHEAWLEFVLIVITAPLVFMTWFRGVCDASKR